MGEGLRLEEGLPTLLHGGAIHTPGHRDCPACARAQITNSITLTAAMTFTEAFEEWISRRVIRHAGPWSNARYISFRTERDLRQYARSAAKFFGELRLEEIHAGHLQAYQQARALCDKSAADWESPAGANLIRKEIQTVMRVMRAAGAWSRELAEAFQPLQPAQSDIGRAMSPEEQHRFLHTVASREKWRTLHCYVILALQTTASTNELRALRLGDIFLEQGTIQIRSEGAKNKFRIRTIPLQTPEVIWAVRSLTDRAVELGADGPHCYLFPFHISQKIYDPLRPMSVWGLRKSWVDAREEARVPWLRPYDLRHTAITRMAEAGVPVQVIMSFAGHMSPRMQSHYTSISMASKRTWASRTWTSKVGGD